MLVAIYNQTNIIFTIVESSLNAVNAHGMLQAQYMWSHICIGVPQVIPLDMIKLRLYWSAYIQGRRKLT